MAKTDPPRRPRVFILAVGVAALAVITLLALRRNALEEEYLTALDPFLNGDSVVWQSPDLPYWQNPTFSKEEKIFCRGYQNSLSCSGEPLHPLEPVFPFFFGRNLTFPSSLEKRVVAQTIHYDNKLYQEK